MQDTELSSLEALMEPLTPAGRRRVITAIKKKIAKELEAEGKFTPEERRVREKSAPKQGAKWSETEDVMLRGYYKGDQLGAVAIADVMGRTIPGITARVVRLGMEEDRKQVRMASG